MHRKPRPTIRDVADLAEVATGTVSRVINGFANVGPEVQAKVNWAIGELGYQPNSAAQSMRTQATRMVACVVPDIQNPLYAAVLGAAEAAFSEAGYALLVAGTAWSTERELRLVETLGRRRVDGVIAVTTDERSAALRAAYAALQTPLVLVERQMKLPLASIVATDQARSMQQATAMLLDLGHRDIALMIPPIQNRSGRERAAGFRAAFAARGLQPRDELIVADAQATAEAVTRDLLARRPAPTAMITAGDRSLGGVLRALRAAKRRIPRDISLVSWGDSDLAELVDPPVTAIRYDAAGIGAQAARQLLQALTDGPAAPRSLVPAELILRESCAPPG